ncbi:zinc finger protein 239-like [Archocentrus centrarchus]|uniref:zinc finger protein 239-like n=1 Tax=Archocentrus centrarchus TaxID=63155 RepID=UPI0011EA2257|nr:zinc finger protein 239-like [Archocentrus centrarchus]
MDEVQGNNPGKHSPSQRQLDWQDNSKTEDMEQPSCSTNQTTNASFNQISTNSAVFPTVSKMAQSDKEWSGPMSKLDGTAVSSLPCGVENRCGRMWPSVGGRDQGADEVTPLSRVRSHYQPLFCIQVNEPPDGVKFKRNAAHSNHSSPVGVETVDSQHQQTQPPWSEMQQMDNLSSQNSIYQVPSSQKQESGSAHPQQKQPCLPYACTFCSRRYPHQCQLRIHERVHTREKPYQCTQCGKSFGQFCSLKRHQMVHTGERPFPCPQCGKQFSTSTNLKVHQSVHTGEKRFHCSKCGKNFSFLSNLIRHQALHTAK